MGEAKRRENAALNDHELHLTELELYYLFEVLNRPAEEKEHSARRLLDKTFEAFDLDTWGAKFSDMLEAAKVEATARAQAAFEQAESPAAKGEAERILVLYRANMAPVGIRHKDFSKEWIAFPMTVQIVDYLVKRLSATDLPLQDAWAKRIISRICARCQDIQQGRYEAPGSEAASA